MSSYENNKRKHTVIQERDEAKQNAMIASLRRRIEKLEARIKELEDENKTLRKTESAKLTDYLLNL